MECEENNWKIILGVILARHVIAILAATFLSPANDLPTYSPLIIHFFGKVIPSRGMARPPEPDADDELRFTCSVSFHNLHPGSVKMLDLYLTSLLQHRYRYTPLGWPRGPIERGLSMGKLNLLK